MWTLWGNVYTPRDDDGSDKAREITGRDLSGHGTCMIEGVHLGPLRPVFRCLPPLFNQKTFRRGGWLGIGVANCQPRDPLEIDTILRAEKLPRAWHRGSYSAAAA